LHQSIAFLSTDDLEDYFVWDNLLIQPFSQHGVHVDVISWHAIDIDWSQYDAVIVRSTWDYQEHADAFIDKLIEITKHDTVLINPLSLMQWNISKRYLQILQTQGITIIPSVFFDSVAISDIYAQFAYFDTQEIIIKPLISANSDNTFRLDHTNLMAQAGPLSNIFSTTPCVIQPFLDSVINEGEYSLFYFNGEYSHTIRKVPKSGDFRVQEEHGGELITVIPDERQLSAAAKVLAALPEKSLYARVDLIRNPRAQKDDIWQLMEVELIEPSLYFNMDEASPERFVQATLNYLA
jgi:glutathione synthase/RimK-type ligase-like ATP-grasp enzyme